VLVITSAGCNALSGARVVAVDVNPRQNQLLELKRAGIRALDFGSFFELFGRGGSRRTREIHAALRPALPPESREHWDREIRLFEPDRARGHSFYYGGTSGLVALAAKAWLRHGARLWAWVERLLDARTVEEQVGPWGPIGCGLRRSHVFLGEERLRALRGLFPRHHEAIRSVGLWSWFLFEGERSA
jgi:S-adenosylmethionine:diacylglycerol 3-amino-3-carboxypropyl transferase